MPTLACMSSSVRDTENVVLSHSQGVFTRGYHTIFPKNPISYGPQKMFFLISTDVTSLNYAASLLLVQAPAESEYSGVKTLSKRDLELA